MMNKARDDVKAEKVPNFINQNFRKGARILKNRGGWGKLTAFLLENEISQN